MNSITHFTKKKQILARKELRLQRLVASTASPDKLAAAAEDIRDGRVRVLRALRTQIVPEGDADAHYRKIDDRIRRILATPIAAILAEFNCPIDPNETGFCRPKWQLRGREVIDEVIVASQAYPVRATGWSSCRRWAHCQRSHSPLRVCIESNLPRAMQPLSPANSINCVRCIGPNALRLGSKSDAHAIFSSR
jgi:hypothetical protein